MSLLSDDGFVRFAQGALADAGFYHGPIDGLAGDGTQGALLKALAIDKPKDAAADIGTDLDPRSESKLKGVHADLVRVVRLAAKTAPLPFVVLEGLRSVDRQKQLVASGASQTMRSRHLTGHAVDIAPLDAKGQISWDWPLYHRLAPAVKQAAEELGVAVTWGGDWGASGMARTGT